MWERKGHYCLSSVQIRSAYGGTHKNKREWELVVSEALLKRQLRSRKLGPDCASDEGENKDQNGK